MRHLNTDAAKVMVDLLGIRVIEAPWLPVYPDHKTDARRIVRTGMYAALPWLKGDPGPAPGAPTVAMLVNGRGGAPVIIVDSKERLTHGP